MHRPLLQIGDATAISPLIFDKFIIAWVLILVPCPATGTSFRGSTRLHGYYSEQLFSLPVVLTSSQAVEAKFAADFSIVYTLS